MDIDFFLIQKMKRGNEAAFDIFVRKYYTEILQYCSYHCHDSFYAEDLTQETFVRFFTKLSDYRYMGKTKNYLFTIAGNLCKDYYKKIKEDILDELNWDKHYSTNSSMIEEIYNKIVVQAALENLPIELREVVVLYYFQDMKLAEIAETLNIGLPLVKYRMKQAKVKLEKMLLKED